ncbi:glycosyltransferase family 2 protein [Paludibaculum fermentans]|uniref:Glycosyltransferase family 2 protein n=2 Tax=Paludibaculum fermentans TaxID=1473598 RepID=A0A7S7NYD6_PALFE|nr:glycosyltransferase family 2 protein [Paludibaculum fermentans]
MTWTEAVKSSAGSLAADKLPVTALIAVRNEEANLRRCLEALAPAAHVVVVDSNSTDGTARIAAAMGAEVVQFQYPGGYPKKRQWVLDQDRIQTPWVLLVDADEVMPPALWAEVRAAMNSAAPATAYLAKKEFHFLGRRFRFGGFSHSAVLLFRRGQARFEDLLSNPPKAQDMEVHERLIVQGAVGRFHTPLIHEDFKGLDAYSLKHAHYASWEAAVRHQYLQSGRWGHQAIAARATGNAQEFRRFVKSLVIRMPGEGAMWFLYHYVVRLGFLEGRRGLIASQLRANYIREARAKLYELQLRAGGAR